MITREMVFGVLGQVMHPEIKRSLVELEMIQDLVVDDSSVTFTLLLPDMNLPPKEHLAEAQGSGRVTGGHRARRRRRGQ